MCLELFLSEKLFWALTRQKDLPCGNDLLLISSSSQHSPNYSGHHLTGEEDTEHGKSLAEQQAHSRERQHQEATEVWNIKNKTKHILIIISTNRILVK